VKTEQIQNISVIGLGAMGPGIAQSFAQAGYAVIGFDTNPQAAPACAELVKANLATLVEAGIITGSDAESTLGRISYTSSLEEALSEAHIAIEAVSENRDIKRAVYEEVDRLAPENCFLWSNTSTLNIYELVPSRRQSRTIIAHWFLPPHIIPLVELVKGPETSSETLETALTLLERQDKLPIVIEKYVPGFIINRLLRILGREAFFLLDGGYISQEDLDLAVKASLAPRMMVLGLIQRYDFTGLDLSARNLLDENFFDPPIENRPRALQSRIDRGDLGVKAGKGFYDYGDKPLAQICQERDQLLLRVMQNLKFCLEKKRLV
jgi:3-hydroxybutyryl-CoA dehydrogenase